MGLEDAYLYDSDRELAHQAFDWEDPRLRGIDLERLERDGYARLSVGAPHLPFAEGGFPTPSGKCELLAESRAEAGGIDPLAGYVPPRESVAHGTRSRSSLPRLITSSTRRSRRSRP